TFCGETCRVIPVCTYSAALGCTCDDRSDGLCKRNGDP
nr:Chain A, Palicourein [Palicourea condensata]